MGREWERKCCDRRKAGKGLGRVEDFILCCVSFSRKRLLEAPRDPKSFSALLLTKGILEEVWYWFGKSFGWLVWFSHNKFCTSFVISLWIMS